MTSARLSVPTRVGPEQVAEHVKKLLHNLLGCSRVNSPWSRVHSDRCTCVSIMTWTTCFDTFALTGVFCLLPFYSLANCFKSFFFAAETGCDRVCGLKSSRLWFRFFGVTWTCFPFCYSWVAHIWSQQWQLQPWVEVLLTETFATPRVSNLAAAFSAVGA